MVKLVRFSSLILSLLILTSTSVFSRSNSNTPRDLDVRAAKIAQLLSLEKFSRSRTGGDQFVSPAGTGAISGKVVGPENAPIHEAWVVAWSQNVGDPTKNFARTNEEGNYVIDGLPAGMYLVAAEAEGFFAEFYNNVRSLQEATPVFVEEASTTGGIDFALEPRSEGSGSISGTVTDGSGSPVVGAKVIVFSTTNPFLHGQAYTGEGGSYTVDGLPTGDYYVAVWAEGFLMEFYDNVRTLDLATPVTVTDPGETSGIDFALSAGGSISGIVTADDGTPIAEADVTAMSGIGQGTSLDFGGWGNARTDEGGHYRISGLAVGDYIVSATAWNQWLYVVEWYDNVESPDNATPVPVVEGQETTDINFSLSLSIGSGSISGRVTDSAGNPLAEVLIQVDMGDMMGGGTGTVDPSGSHGFYSHAFTDKEGNYRLGELPEGSYFVSAHFWNSRVYIVRWYNNVDSPEEATAVPVANDQEVTGIDFTIPVTVGNGSISGTVTAEDGRPLAKVLVQAWLPQSENSWWGSVEHGWTNELGQYVIDGLEAGSYLVSADYMNDWVHLREWYDNVEDAGNATPVEVAANQETQNINFSLDIEGALGSISGRIVSDADGSPIPHAFVEARRAETTDIGVLKARGVAYTDAEGFYTIKYLAEGQYYVSAFAYDVREYYDNVQSVEEATLVPVVGGSTTESIDFGFTPPPESGGSISGTVTDDATGYPVVSAIVIAIGREILLNTLPVHRLDPLYVHYATSDEVGRYSIRALENGAYFILCFAEGYIGEIYDNVFDPGQATFVEVQDGAAVSGIDIGLSQWQEVGPGIVEGGGHVEGNVADADGTPIEGAYIYAFNPDGKAVGFGRSSEDGNYAISGLADGSFHLQASRLGFQTGYYGGTTNLESSIPISLGSTSGLTVQSVNFSLEPASVTPLPGPGATSVPSEFRLYQNFPNPFNPSTEIRYDIAEDSDVELVVFNLLGQEVVGLVRARQQAGSYVVTWNGRDASGREVPSGIYFYRIQAGVSSEVRKAMLLR